MRSLTLSIISILFISSMAVFSQDGSSIDPKIIIEAQKGSFGGGYQDYKWGTSFDKVDTELTLTKNILDPQLIPGVDGFSSAKKTNVLFRFYKASLYSIEVKINSRISQDRTNFDNIISVLTRKYGKGKVTKDTPVVSKSNDFNIEIINTFDTERHTWSDEYTTITTYIDIITRDLTEKNQKHYEYNFGNTVCYTSKIISTKKSSDEVKKEEDKRNEQKKQLENQL